MKTYRLLLAAALVALIAGACSNPAAPRYPQPEEEPPGPPPNTGYVIPNR